MRQIIATTSQNKGFITAAEYGNKSIRGRYGNKTGEMVRSKKETNRALFTILNSILRYDELIEAGFDADEVDFQTSSIRREIREFYSKSEKTDAEKEFMARLESPIQYSQENLEKYDDSVEVSSVHADVRSSDEYLGGVRTVKSAIQRQARDNATRKRNEPKRLIR
jgi:hypothetical protein